VFASQFGEASPTAACDAIGHGKCQVQSDSVLLQTQQTKKTITLDRATDHANAGSAEGTAVLGENICRFAKLEWLNLQTDEAVQNQYIASALRWDGKFAAPGAAVSTRGMTRDHIALNDDGSVKRIASYTAPSKENLHISMLAIVLDGESPVAWNFLIDSLPDGLSPEERGLEKTELKGLAEAEALRRLESIIGEYERWRETCPGCAGYMNWMWVDEQGWVEQPGDKVKGVPALDNGQMAWSLIAAAQVLEEKGHAELAARFQVHIDGMAASAATLFVGADKKRSSSSVNVKEKTKDVGSGQIAQKGMLRDPFEGELMIMFETLLADGIKDHYGAKKKLWKKVKKGVIRREYNGPSECIGCMSEPISVESGWRFSAHEQWKFLILPYMDDPTARRVFVNGERARAWDAHLRHIPGMMAAAYRPPHSTSASDEPVYMDTLGVESASYGYTEPKKSDLVVSPYGSFPLILADQGQGLAWHQSVLARPKMQSQYGSMEATEAFPEVGEPRVASIMTWDTKVTTDIAMSGGTVDILRRFLQREEGRYERFLEIIADQLSGFENLSGENAGWPSVPEIYSASSEDFATCTV